MDKLIKLILFLVFVLGITNLSGCGDGGGGGGGSATTNKAVIVFSTSLPAGSTESIGTVQISFELPAGMTLSTDSSGAVPNGPNGALSISGEAVRFAAQPNAVTPFILGKYIPATATSKASVNMGILVTPNNAKGMNPGEFATLVCDLTPGVTIDLATFKATSAQIGNTEAVWLYNPSINITGPASATYMISLQNDSNISISGASSASGTF